MHIETLLYGETLLAGGTQNEIFLISSKFIEIFSLISFLPLVFLIFYFRRDVNKYRVELDENYKKYKNEKQKLHSEKKSRRLSSKDNIELGVDHIKEARKVLKKASDGKSSCFNTLRKDIILEIVKQTNAAACHDLDLCLNKDVKTVTQKGKILINKYSPNLLDYIPHSIRKDEKSEIIIRSITRNRLNILLGSCESKEWKCTFTINEVVKKDGWVDPIYTLKDMPKKENFFLCTNDEDDVYFYEKYMNVIYKNDRADQNSSDEDWDTNDG